MDRPAQHLYSVVRHLSAKYTQGREGRSGGGRAGIEVYAYNPRMLKAAAWGAQVRSQPGEHSKILSQK